VVEVTEEQDRGGTGSLCALTVVFATDDTEPYSITFPRRI